MIFQVAIRNIVKDGDPVLSKKCRPVEKFDEKLAQLLDDMADTLKKAGGVGLAAPQVGILRRAFIMILEEDGPVIEAVKTRPRPSRSGPSRPALPARNGCSISRQVR